MWNNTAAPSPRSRGSGPLASSGCTSTTSLAQMDGSGSGRDKPLRMIALELPIEL